MVINSMVCLSMRPIEVKLLGVVLNILSSFAASIKLLYNSVFTTFDILAGESGR